MNRMTQELHDEWQHFLLGEWTRTAPTEPGTYAIADYAGRHGGLSIVVYRTPGGVNGYALGGVSSARASQVWGGWFWSVPTPPLPLAPAFDEKNIQP